MEKRYLEIKSFGHIDTQAFSLIGASTKRGDSGKIGLYGSGNKYSIATLLRQNIDFKVFSGEDEISFTTRSQNFRDQNFEVILINGQETSLTTTMGGDDWNTAFAPIREIYSNALDEDSNSTIKQVSSFDPENGYTKFYIEMTEGVEHFYKNIHLYFCNHNPKVLYSSASHGSIFENTDNNSFRVFRKGILSHFDPKLKALFHYNFTDLDINESRVVKYVWQIDSRIGQILKTTTNEAIINTLLLQLNGGNAGFVEHKADWNTYTNFSSVWLNVCKTYKFVPVEFAHLFKPSDVEGRLGLPMKMLKALKSQFDELDILGLGQTEKGDFVEVEASTILTDKVIDAIIKLNNTEYKFRLKDPIIKYVHFSDEKVLGLANEGVIYLSTKLDVYGIDEIAKIIIEENEHNITGFEDETREFQNHLFSLYYDKLTR